MRDYLKGIQKKALANIIAGLVIVVVVLAVMLIAGKL